MIVCDYMFEDLRVCKCLCVDVFVSGSCVRGLYVWCVCLCICVSVYVCPCACVFVCGFF